MQFIEVIIVNYLIIGGCKHPGQMCTEWNCNHMTSHGNNDGELLLSEAELLTREDLPGLEFKNLEG